MSPRPSVVTNQGPILDIQNMSFKSGSFTLRRWAFHEQECIHSQFRMNQTRGTRFQRQIGNVFFFSQPSWKPVISGQIEAVKQAANLSTNYCRRTCLSQSLVPALRAHVCCSSGSSDFRMSLSQPWDKRMAGGKPGITKNTKRSPECCLESNSIPMDSVGVN